MNVIVLTCEYEPLTGGLGLAVVRACHALRLHAHARITVIVCGTWHESEPYHAVRDGVDVYRVKFTGLPERRILRPALRSTIVLLHCLRVRFRIGADLIISHGVNDLGVLGGILGALTMTPSITMAHGPRDVQQVAHVRGRRMWMHLALELNNGVVVTNSYFMNHIQKYGHEVAICVIPNIASDHKGAWRHEVEAESRPFRVALVGRTVVEHGMELKGFSYALHALKRMPNVQMILFGDGPHRSKLEQLAEELDIQERIKFRGVIPRHELHSELSEMHMLLHPALVEGLSMVILEAMSMGVPISSTTVGGLRDVIIDGVTAMEVAPRSIDDIVTVCTKASMDYPSNLRCAARAKEYIDTYTAPETVTLKLLEFLQQLGVERFVEPAVG